MKERLFRFRRWAVAGLTASTVVGGVAIVGAGSASAVATYASVTSLTAKSTPNVSAGQNSQAAGDWTLVIPNTFSAGSVVTIQVGDANTNPPVAPCGTANDFIAFSSTPKVAVAADAANTGTTDTAPTVTPSLSSSTSLVPNCANPGVNDTLTLTIGNTATGTAGDKYDISISGVSYDVGSAAHLGLIEVSVNAGTESTGPANANVTDVTVTANSPAVGVNLPAPGYKATHVAISNITMAESIPGVIPAGWVCVTISRGTFDVSSGSPTATASGGGAALVASTTLAPNPYAPGGTSEIAFDIKTASSGTPATYTLGNLFVDDTSSRGPSNLSIVDGGNNNTCGTSTGSLASGGPSAFDAIETERYFGNTVDDTAIQTFKAFNESYWGTDCNTNIVLARDDVPFDALAGAYLESDLQTAILLTPGGPNTTTVSQTTLNEIRNMGAQNVYVLGGNQALSDAIVSQLQGTPAYQCGGTTPVGSGTTLNVLRIYGNTADGTAAAIDSYVGTGGSADIAGAYSGVYNDTTGADSASAPKSTSLATAILSTDGGWQDAVSASGVSWESDYPILLTPTGSLGTDAQDALVSLGIQQVIVMGGPAAVSDAVVSQLQSMGIYVLRVAGQDFTDTSQLFARFMTTCNTDAASQNEGLCYDEPYIFVSRGDYFGDSLAAAAVSGYWGYPTLLTFDPNTLGQYLTSFLNDAGMPGGIDSSVGDVRWEAILGGSVAVTGATVQNDLNAVSAGNNAS